MNANEFNEQDFSYSNLYKCGKNIKDCLNCKQPYCIFDSKEIKNKFKKPKVYIYDGTTHRVIKCLLNNKVIKKFRNFSEAYIYLKENGKTNMSKETTVSKLSFAAKHKQDVFGYSWIETRE